MSILRLFKCTRFMNYSTTMQKGFSLLEILIVMGLIGGIVVFVLNNVTKGKAESDVGSAEAKMQTLFGTLIKYQSKNGKYPETKDGLDALLAKVQGISYATEEDLVDPWGTKFDYELTNKGPKIVSAGIDATLGTDDDITYVNGKKPQAEQPKQ